MPQKITNTVLDCYDFPRGGKDLGPEIKTKKKNKMDALSQMRVNEEQTNP